MIVALGLGQALVRASLRRLKDGKTQRHVDLRGGEACAVRVDHGLDHVANELLDCRGCRVRHRIGLPGQHRMPHARDLEDSHGVYMSLGPRPVKANLRAA